MKCSAKGVIQLGTERENSDHTLPVRTRMRCCTRGATQLETETEKSDRPKTRCSARGVIQLGTETENSDRLLPGTRKRCSTRGVILLETETENIDRPLPGTVQMRKRCSTRGVILLGTGTENSDPVQMRNSTSGAIPLVMQTENSDRPFPAHMRRMTIYLAQTGTRDHQLPALAKIAMRCSTSGAIRLVTQTESSDHPSPTGEKKMCPQSLGIHNPKVCQNTSIVMMTVLRMILMTIRGNQHVGLLRRRLRMMSTTTTTLTATQKCNLRMAHGGQLQRTISRAFSVVNKTTLTLLTMLASAPQAAVRPTKIRVMRMTAEHRTLVIVDLRTDLGIMTMTELQNHLSKGTV
jgi:hypothetical protein